MICSTVVAALGLTLGVASASASTVAVKYGDFRIEYEAGPGEVNDLRIDTSGNEFVEVLDPGATIVPGENCFAASAHRALCKRPFGPPMFGEEHSSLIELADGDDRFELVGQPTFSYVGAQGGDGDDVLTGENSHFAFEGGPGDDRLLGGNEGDYLDGGEGADFLKGNGGDDAASYTNRTEDLTVTIDNEANDGAPGEGDNVQAENVILGSGDDRVVGNAAANSLFGGAGDDQLEGGGGNDSIDGSTGADEIAAGDGNDRIELASERKVLVDNAGNTYFAADPYPDVAACGRGGDIVIAGPEDRSAVDCERTSWGWPPDMSILGPDPLTASGSRVSVLIGRGEQSGQAAAAGTLTLRTLAGKLIARGSLSEIDRGETQPVSLVLTKRGRRELARRPRMKVRATLDAKMQDDASNWSLTRRVLRLKRGA